MISHIFYDRGKDNRHGEHRRVHSRQKHPDRRRHHRHRTDHAEAPQDHRKVRAQVGHSGVSPQKKNSFGKNMFAFFRLVQLLAKIVGLLAKALGFR